MFFIMMLIILASSLSSASLGTFKQGEPVNIRILANCSSINLTEVNDGVNTFVINSVMTKIGGQTFNYTFLNTSSIGTYSYSWNNPCVDCSTNECGNSFDVTKYGNNTVLWLVIIVFVFFVSIIAIIYYIKNGSMFDIKNSESKCSRYFEDYAPIKGIIMSVLHSFLEHYLLFSIVLGIIPVWCLSEIVSISGMTDLVNIMNIIFNIYFVLILFTTLYWFDRVFRFIKDMKEQADDINRGVY